MNIPFKNKFLKDSSVLFVAMMLSNICSFGFQLFMGRKLSFEDFGILNSLLSFFVILSVPTTTLQLVIARYVSQFKAENNFAKIRYFLITMIKKIAPFLIGGLCFFLLFSRALANFFHIPSLTPIIIVGGLLATSFCVPLAIGSLQGLQNFKFVGITTIVGGFGRLLFGVVMISIGIRVNGALGASLFANVIVLIVALYPMMFLASYKEKVSSLGLKKDLITYSLSVMIATICYNSFTNIDLVLVKHYFDPDTAGMYASVVILGKTILYLPAVISMVMFPVVSEADTNNTDVFSIFYKSIVYTLGLCSFGFICFLLFPEFSLNLFFGGKFNQSADLLQLYSFSMIFMAIIFVVMNFNLARKNNTFIYSMVVGSIMQIGMIVLFHNSLKQVITVSIITSSFVIIANILLFFLEKRKVMVQVLENS